MSMLQPTFFDRDACLVAQQLLGKIIRRKHQGSWLNARIIEAEAYYLAEKGSHASLGYTEKRKALFMPAGTIYMYYARGKDSLNVSCRGEGNAVLIKSAFPFVDKTADAETLRNLIDIMQGLNPTATGGKRPAEKLCSGQTLLCQSLDLKVTDWDGRQFDENIFYLDDTGISVDKIIRTTRLGIPAGRDEHLMYRYIDYDYARYCTSNPLSRRNLVENIDYRIIKNKSA
jgi:DNA-3-methyladenine glycosylase